MKGRDGIDAGFARSERYMRGNWVRSRETAAEWDMGRTES